MTDRPDLLENLGSQDAVDRAAKIALLNDALRCGRRGPNDTILVMGDLSAHIQSLEPANSLELQVDLTRKLAFFSNFSESNDPWGERDSGSFEVQGKAVRWKIDYYDLDKRYGSTDPTDPEVTSRVLTIFYASDY